MLEFKRVEKTNLADDLAERIAEMIRTRVYEPGDRLPSIMEMAKSFGVGHPTVREALKKLEIIGIVTIKHGSGVYVGTGGNNLLVSNPVKSGVISKKLLVDLVEARIPIELASARMAAVAATEEHLDTMEQLLAQAELNIEDDEALSAANMGFHCEIAKASGNTVLAQMQQALTNLFQREQRQILSIYSSRELDHQEHREIYEALRDRDAELAVERMSAHLAGVREVLEKWDPETTPLT
jgi:GntR family transcriptional regulator, transcriptional repressor for pyruvate dehydrogenase complex